MSQDSVPYRRFILLTDVPSSSTRYEFTFQELCAYALERLLPHLTPEQQARIRKDQNEIIDPGCAHNTLSLRFIARAVRFRGWELLERIPLSSPFQNNKMAAATSK